MLKNEKILITGPTSQVAFSVTRELAQHNEVHGLARFGNPEDRERLGALGVRCIAADMIRDDFAQVPEDFTYVLNFAVLKSESFDDDLAANAEGLGRLMYRCRKAKAILHASSSGVYEYAGQRPLKETDPLAENHRVILPTYSIAKIAAEVMARFASRQWRIPTTIARFNVTYGDNGGWPSLHLDGLLAGQPIPLHPERPNTFSPIHEDDYIALIPRLLEVATVPPTLTNLGGRPLSIEEWCAYLGELIGVKPRFVTADRVLRSLVLDLTRMHQLVGPTRIDWHDGFRRMVQARHPEVDLRS